VGLDEGKVIDVFIIDLQEAVNKAAPGSTERRTKKRHALAWLRDHPVYHSKWISLYTSRQKSELMEYYAPLLKKHILFAADTPFSFGFNFGDGGYFITILIDNFGGREETSRVPLEIFIELLGLKCPEDLLSEQEYEAVKASQEETQLSKARPSVEFLQLTLQFYIFNAESDPVKAPASDNWNIAIGLAGLLLYQKNDYQSFKVYSVKGLSLMWHNQISK
jgi:hypothetical protein